MVETALTVSVLLLLIIGVIEFAFAFWQWNTMQLAVEQAGRYVMLNNATCTASCAETQMQTVLTAAAVCTKPSAGQTCVNATSLAAGSSLCPDSTTPCMALAAYYGFNSLVLTGSFTIATWNTVPLD